MNKKRIILIGIILICLSAIIAFIVTSSNTPTVQYENNKHAETKHDSNHNEEENVVEDEQQEEAEEQEESQGTVQKAILDVVQGTIDFFSNKNLNIVAVGDSLTQGVGDSQNEGGYVGIIDRTINEDNKHANIQNFGKRGDRTDQLLLRLDDSKVATSVSEADIILMTIGANDIMQVVKQNFTHLTYDKFVDERENYEERLHAIFERLRSLNDEADIYLIGFYNPFAKYFPDIEELGVIVDDWNELGQKITEEFDDTHYIPIKDLFKDEDIDLFADDHFHPNDIGYERMARRILDYITEEER